MVLLPVMVRVGVVVVVAMLMKEMERVEGLDEELDRIGGYGAV